MVTELESKGGEVSLRSNTESVAQPALAAPRAACP